LQPVFLKPDQSLNAIGQTMGGIDETLYGDRCRKENDHEKTAAGIA
jgi:hypothetical protein